MSLDANLDLARRAIEYLKGLNINSVNKPQQHVTGWIDTIFGTNLDAYNQFLICAMRYDWRAAGRPDKKGDRAAILTIMRSTMPAGQKKKMLKDIMRRLGGAEYFCDDNQFAGKPVTAPDQERIRSARRAIKFRQGNCGEKSAICATYCLENSGGPLNIFWIDANTWDHAYVVIGASLGDFGTNYSQFPDEAVVVDGWSEDYYQLKSWKDIRQGIHVPNPFQVTVRMKLNEHCVGVNILEEVHLHNPPIFSPNFRLAVADQPNRSYAVPAPPPPPAPVPPPSPAVAAVVASAGAAPLVPTSTALPPIIELDESTDDPDELYDDLMWDKRARTIVRAGTW
jgi:hypothetical protein